MVSVSIKVDKKVNLLLVLYQIAEGKVSFPHLGLLGVEKLHHGLRKEIRRMIKKASKQEDFLQESFLVSEIYNKNVLVWEKYWDANHPFLERVAKKLEVMANQFDFSVFDRLEHFFESQGPEEVTVWVCMGNESEIGYGNAFSESKANVFPRCFSQESEETLRNDFGVLLHEIVHHFQPDLSDKGLREKIARCFAPRGILFGEEFMERSGGSLVFYYLVKKSFEKQEKLSDILSELENINA